MCTARVVRVTQPLGTAHIRRPVPCLGLAGKTGTASMYPTAAKQERLDTVAVLSSAAFATAGVGLVLAVGGYSAAGVSLAMDAVGE